MGLLVNVLHHFSGLQEVIGTLQQGLAVDELQRIGTCTSCGSIASCLHVGVIVSLQGKLLRSVVVDLRLAERPRLVVESYVFLQVLRLLSFARHLLFREKGLSFVLESFHQAFCLEVRVESH